MPVQGGPPPGPGLGGMQGGMQGMGVGGGRMQAISGPQVFRPTSGRSGPEAPKLHLFQKTLRDMITGMRQARPNAPISPPQCRGGVGEPRR